MINAALACPVSYSAPAFDLMKLIPKALVNGTRSDNRPALVKMLNDVAVRDEPYIRDGVPFGITRVFSMKGSPVAETLLGFKFHVFLDGSSVIELMLAGGTPKELSAVLDMAAACLAEMDQHALMDNWDGATP